MDSRSATEMYSKPHKEKGCDDQAKSPAVVDINSTGKTAAKREQNRLPTAKCRARKRSNVERISEKSREMSSCPAIMSHVSAPIMLWAAAQAGVQYDPGMRTDNLTSLHKHQV